MTEVERLKERLFGGPVKVKNIKWDAGPEATAESLAREINAALDEIESGRAQPVDDID